MPEPRPDRSQMTTGIVLVVLIGLLLLLFALLSRDGDTVRGVAGAVVFLLAVVPMVLATRAQPASIGRRYLRQQSVQLGWFVVAIAVCGLGLLIFQT